MPKQQSDDPALKLWPLMLKAHALLMDKIQSDLRAMDWPSLEWYDLLWTLEQADGQRLRMNELADRVLLTRSNLTRLVDKLEEAGYIERHLCSEDRRGFYALLTKQGQEIRKRMWPDYAKSIQQHMAEAINVREAEGLAKVFAKLIDGK